MYMQVPPEIRDRFREATGKAMPDELLAKARRDLTHACIEIRVNNPEFLQMYTHGFVHVCGDGVKRPLLPRLFWYLADYPEK